MSTDKIPSLANCNDLYYIIYVMQLIVIKYKSLLSLNVH